MGNVLIFVEDSKGELPKSSLVAISAGQEIASKTGSEAVGVVLGQGVGGAAEAAAKHGLGKVINVDDARLEHYLADIYAKAVGDFVILH